MTYYYPTAAAIFSQGNVPAVTIGGLGNTAVKPERSEEIEAGFDIGFKSRISAEFTYYSKETSDALINRELPGSLGAVTSIGREHRRGDQQGHRAVGAGRPIEASGRSRGTWPEYADNKNELVSLAEGMPPLTGFGYRNAPGYPLFGIWWPRMKSFDDANGDGIISPSRKSRATDTAEFQGSTGADPTFGLNSTRSGSSATGSGWPPSSTQGRLRDPQRQPDVPVRLPPELPVAERSEQLAGEPGQGGDRPAGVRGVRDKADNIRLREMSLSYDMPAKWARAIRASNTTVTLTGHNICALTDPRASTPGIRRATRRRAPASDGPNYNFVQPGQTGRSSCAST